jgi:hypothetical protein
MTIFIQTSDDAQDLKYVAFICETFKHVTKTAVEFRFRKENDPIESQDCLINYGLPPKEGCINIPRVLSRVQEGYCYGKCDSSFFTDARLSDTALPVYRQLLSNQQVRGSVVFSEASTKAPLISSAGSGTKGINVHFDFFYNIFCFLGNIPDIAFEEKHGIAHSYAKFIRRDQAFYGKPWVNYFFIIFQSLIEAVSGKSLDCQKSPRRLGFQVLMMYDVDAIRKTPIMQAKQLLFIVINLFRSLFEMDFKKSREEGKRFFRFIFFRCNYLCFEVIASGEESLRVPSIFNIYQKIRYGRIKKIKSLIFDPAYDISKEAVLKDSIKMLIRKGKGIGLHSGYNSYASSGELLLQKSMLSRTLNYSVRGLRQHWLRFSVKNTWKAQEEAGFLYDASFGFNDAIGFRSGLAHPYFPYSHEEGRSYRILEVPPVLMDSTLMHYGNRTEESAFTEAVCVLKEVKKFAGTCVMVWHQESFCRDYGWGNLLKRILGWVADSGGSFISEQELLSQYNLLH